MYKNLDTGFDELEKLQYGYELSWQGEWIKEYINSIFKIILILKIYKEDYFK